jgi:hypothetical protein
MDMEEINPDPTPIKDPLASEAGAEVGDDDDSDNDDDMEEVEMDLDGD